MANKRRADGRIQKAVYIGKDKDGKKQYKYVFGKTQKEVDKAAAELKAKLGKGMDIIAESDSFGEWAEATLRAKQRRARADDYKLAVTRLNYFLPYFGHLPIKDIKPYMIEEALDDLAAVNPKTGKPTAKKTLNGYKQVVSQVFKFAIKNRAIEHNPVNEVTVSTTAPTKQRRALTEQEREKVLTAPDSCRWKLPAMLATFAGLRRGEMALLTWSDIDLKNKLIDVNKAYDYKNSEVKGTKTYAGTRVISIPDILAEFLARQPKKQALVVLTTEGEMMSSSAWDRLNEKMLADFGHNADGLSIAVKPFGWHDLRHTYATILFEAGVDVLTAQHLIGHADPSTTLRIYTHLSEQQKMRSADKLNAFLSGGRSEVGQAN